MDDLDVPFSRCQSPPRFSEQDVDYLNDETFGSGAVDDNWEDCHDQFVEQLSRGSNIDGRKTLDDDELELSNQQLAAAVEELVLNSDFDQDVIDPAIVSLRKESKHSSYNIKLNDSLVSPYLTERSNFGRASPSYSSQIGLPSSVFQSDELRNIWCASDGDALNSYPQSSPMVLERQVLDDKLKNMTEKSHRESDLKDAAILSAVKALDFQSCGTDEIIRKLFQKQPAMLSAEKLEKSHYDMRVASPTLGFNLSTMEDSSQNVHESLPARSISPILGSPQSAHSLPIETPPKHKSVEDMMIQQNQKQGVEMIQRLTGQVIAAPQHGYVLPQGQRMPLGKCPLGKMQRPMQPFYPDVMNKWGTNKNSPTMVRSPANMSTMGSPQLLQLSHMSPPHGLRPLIRTPGPVRLGMTHPVCPYLHSPYQRMGKPIYSLWKGTHQLHPRHSQFVDMKTGHCHSNNNYHHRLHDRDEYLKDPYSNLMTSKEKEWVIRIQMMALQSDRPEIDDYYYQHYIEEKLKEGKLLTDDETTKQKRLITPTKINPDHKKYVPVQYDNSLGKLTVSSVYNPRQIIDVSHPEKEDDTLLSVDASMSMKKRLEIYSVIENSYLCLLELEEIRFENKIQPKQDHQKDAGRKNKSKYGQYYVRKLKESILPENSITYITKLLRLRKGKRLICRILPHLAQDDAKLIVCTLLIELPSLVKREKEGLLQELYPSVIEVVCRLEVDALFDVISKLTSILDHHVCCDKFGYSLTCKLLVLVHDTIDFSNEEVKKKEKIWLQFLLASFKLFLSLQESKSSIPCALEANIDAKAISVLAEHRKTYFGNDVLCSL